MGQTFPLDQKIKTANRNDYIYKEFNNEDLDLRTSLKEIVKLFPDFFC